MSSSAGANATTATRAGRRRRGASPWSKEATRTPSRRTGRGGAYSRSSSSATPVTTAGSFVGVGDRARARDRREVVEADLDRDVRPRRSCLARPLAELLGEAARIVLELAPGRRCRRRTSSRATRRPRSRTGVTPGRALEARAARRSARGWRRSARRAAPRGAAASAPSVVIPMASSRGDGLGPDAGHEARRRVGEARARLLADRHDEPARLLGVGGDLRHEPVRADADRAVSPVSSRIVARPAGASPRSARRGREVEVGLVEPDDLDASTCARTSAMTPRRLPVGVKSGGMRTASGHSRRARDGRHRRADPERARLVGRGGDDRPRARCRTRSRACRAAPAGAAARRSRRTRRCRDGRSEARRHNEDRTGPVPPPRRGTIDASPTVTGSRHSTRRSCTSRRRGSGCTSRR